MNNALINQEDKLKLLKAYLSSPEKAQFQPLLRQWRHEVIHQPVISVSNSSCARISGSEKVLSRIETYLENSNQKAILRTTACYGNCKAQPYVDIQLPGRFRLTYAKVDPEEISNILESVFSGDVHHSGLLGQHPVAGNEAWEGVNAFSELPWNAGQRKILTALSGEIDPESLHEYIAHGGYSSLLSIIRNNTKEEVCGSIEKSGLQGRSGSGFPTAKKWRSALETAADHKYVICNADESDPSAFTARHTIEANPHQLIEGTAIAAYAIGADRAIIYLGENTGHCGALLEKAISDAAEAGLIGTDIQGSGFSLQVSIFNSPGAFICGEETALISSLEGKRGVPHHKPPYPSASGYHGKPSLVNNAETLMNLPHIISKGPEWFRSLGTKQSPGTKLFSISGMTRWPGLYEVEMGTELHELIFRTAGGLKEESEFKALLVGGLMGHLLNEENLNTKISFEEIAGAKLSLGSGGMLVLDKSVCTIDLAHYALDFLAEESCGKCITCREGLRAMNNIMDMVVGKSGKTHEHKSLERFKGAMQLQDLGKLARQTALCGLGQNSGNIINDIFIRFKAELEAHIFDRYCEAGVCKDLRSYTIDPDKCTGCTICAKKCPENAISGSPKHPHVINENKCRGCGICYDVCKFSAISMI